MEDSRLNGTHGKTQDLSSFLRCHPPTYSLSALPTTAVGAAVDVKNLARDLPRVSQIENGIDDVVDLGDASHRLQRAEMVFSRLLKNRAEPAISVLV